MLAYQSELGVHQNAVTARVFYHRGARLLVDRCEAGSAETRNHLYFWRLYPWQRRALERVAPPWTAQRIAQRACALGVTERCQR